MRRYLTREFANNSVSPRLMMELEALPSLLEYISTGTSHSILPLAAFHREAKAGRLAAIRIRGLQISRVIITKRSHRLSRPARELVDLLRNQIKASYMASIEGVE